MLFEGMGTRIDHHGMIDGAHLKDTGYIACGQ
jgi:hypothetical protein